MSSGRYSTANVGVLDFDEETVDGLLEQSGASRNGTGEARPYYNGALDLALILEESPAQRRVPFDPEKSPGDAEFLRTIAEQGVIIPICIVHLADVDGKPAFRLVAGSRRRNAAVRAGYETIPAIVYPQGYSSEKLDLYTIIENFHRKEQTPLEMAQQVTYMQETYGMTQSEVAEALRTTQGYISGLAAIQKADPQIKDMLKEGKLGAHSAASLARLSKRELTSALKAIRRGITVDSAIKTVQASNGAKPKKKSKAANSAATSDYWTEFLAELVGKKEATALNRYLNKIKDLWAPDSKQRCALAMMHFDTGEGWEQVVERYRSLPVAVRKSYDRASEGIVRLYALKDVTDNSDRVGTLLVTLAKGATKLGAA